MTARALALVVLASLSACGDDGRARDGGVDATGPDGSADGGSMDAGDDARPGDGGPSDGARDGSLPDSASDGSTVDGGGDGGGDGGSSSLPPLCLPSCTTADDCDTGVAPYRAANYRCESGACAWQGCSDDGDCAGRPCRRIGALFPPVCVQACTTAADCGGLTADTDSDNYRCESGGCIWQGCNDDAECVSARGASFVCAESTTLGTLGSATGRYCTETCTVAADCAGTGATSDEDNYRCESGLCVWTGCNDDAECRLLFSSPDYVCR